MTFQANKRGDYFPVWGTCLGYEQLTVLTSGEDLLSLTNTSGVPLPLNFMDGTSALLEGKKKKSIRLPVRNPFCCDPFPGAKSSRMFEGFPAELMEDLASEPLTANVHKWSVSLSVRRRNNGTHSFPGERRKTF